MARADLLSLELMANTGAVGARDAYFELGLMYCIGREVERDLVIAHKWLNIAAMRGNRDARAHRADVAQDMSKAEIAKAQRLAREWMTRH